MAAGRLAGGRPLLHSRLLPPARFRVTRMTDALLFVHQVGARALVAFAVVLGIWGAYLYFRRDAVSGGVRSSLLLLARRTPLRGLPGPRGGVSAPRPPPRRRGACAALAVPL